VPAALEEVAAQLLHSDFMVGTGGSASITTSNIWKSTATLIVSEYL